MTKQTEEPPLNQKAEPAALEEQMTETICRQKCSCTTEHQPHTYGGRPMLFCEGVDPEWVKCPQCGRENSRESWDKNNGKCPNCNDLYHKDGPAEVRARTQPQPATTETVCDNCGKPGIVPKAHHLHVMDARSCGHEFTPRTQPQTTVETVCQCGHELIKHCQWGSKACVAETEDGYDVCSCDEYQPRTQPQPIRSQSEREQRLERALTSINRLTSPGSRTLDDFMRDMGLANDIARAALDQPDNAARDMKRLAEQ